MTKRIISVCFYNEVCGNELTLQLQFFRTSASASVIQAIDDVPRMSNPIIHVGKIYNVLSNIIANDVAKKVKADAEIHVRLQSQIGHASSDPLNANIDIITPTRPMMPGFPSGRTRHTPSQRTGSTTSTMCPRRSSSERSRPSEVSVRERFKNILLPLKPIQLRPGNRPRPLEVRQ